MLFFFSPGDDFDDDGVLALMHPLRGRAAPSFPRSAVPWGSVKGSKVQKSVFAVAVVDGTGPMSAERRRGKMKAAVWGALSIPPAHFAAGGQK